MYACKPRVDEGGARWGQSSRHCNLQVTERPCLKKIGWRVTEDKTPDGPHTHRLVYQHASVRMYECTHRHTHTQTHRHTHRHRHTDRHRQRHTHRHRHYNSL